MDSDRKINPSFVFGQIRKHNSSPQRLYKDNALTAIGLHAGLLTKKTVAIRDLTPQERQKILDFIKEFLASENLEIEMK